MKTEISVNASKHIVNYYLFRREGFVQFISNSILSIILTVSENYIFGHFCLNKTSYLKILCIKLYKNVFNYLLNVMRRICHTRNVD